MFKVPDQYRIRKGAYSSDPSIGNKGFFEINRGRTILKIVASEDLGWEHVSVHCISDGKQRTPTWSEMCLVKDLFWDEYDCVVQYHPPKDDYVNMHKHTLHLWKPSNQTLPVPPKVLV